LAHEKQVIFYTPPPRIAIGFASFVSAAPLKGGAIMEL
jgi:hypothetical protein